MKESDSPLGRFERSMAMDYEKWHDGIGYDLQAIQDASPSEREVIEKLVLQRNAQDWRDVEALAALNTEECRVQLRAAIRSGNAEVQMAVARFAPDLISNQEKVDSLVSSLKSAEFYGGLTQTLDQVAAFHPPEVVDALLDGALRRNGEIAVHFAAMLFFIHGKAESPFDWKHRPFFLQFSTEDPDERKAAFDELRRQIGKG